MKRLTVLLSVLLLALGMTGAAAMADNGLPSQQGDDILDSDSIEVEVAICPTDPEDLPDGVTGVAPQAGTGPLVYIAPWEFVDNGDFADRDDANENMTKVSWYRDGDHWGTWTDIEVANGFDGNWYPPYPSDHDTHSIAYAFQDGTVWTAAANFDDNGCITDLSWTEHEPDVNVSITGEEDLVVGETGSYTVTTTSEPDTPFPNGWQLALEVTGDVASAGDLTITWGDENLELEYDEDAEVVYVYGLNEDALLEDDSQSFEAVFHEDGSFTGTVFAINLREAHTDLDLKVFVDNH